MKYIYINEQLHKLIHYRLRLNKDETGVKEDKLIYIPLSSSSVIVAVQDGADLMI